MHSGRRIRVLGILLSESRDARPGDPALAWVHHVEKVYSTSKHPSKRREPEEPTDRDYVCMGIPR
eukprot:2764073-Rhodomonas_salina.1